MASMYKYYRSLISSQSVPVVEISTSRDICVVNLATYVNGVEIFPCGSGNDKRLSTVDKANINRVLAKLSGIEGMTGTKVRRLRAKLERTVKAHLHEFGDSAKCITWACSELGISQGLLEIMYPTAQAYLAITNFTHIKE